MSEKEFVDELRNMANFKPALELPEFSKTAPEVAKKIINNIERRYRGKISAELEGDSTIIHIRENNYDGRKVIQFQARTAGCTMKKCGSCWNCNYGIKEKSITTPEEYIEEFERLIGKYEGTTLVMEAMGSITDKREFPREALLKMIEIAIKKGKFKSISLETHITQIDEELVKYIDRINKELPEEQRKFICFEVGIEDFNPENRQLINKIGVNNSKIKQVYDLLDSYGMELDCNLIYGFPFLTEDERIDAMIQNIEFAKNNLPNAGMILFLMSIKDNTIMEHMQKTGHYRLPNPWGFVEVAKNAIENCGDNNYIGFSWFGEKEDPMIGQKKAYCCPECQKLIIDALKEINGSYDREVRKQIMTDLIENAKLSECNHYNEFQEEIKKQRERGHVKNRYRRLMDYFADVVNAENGSIIEGPHEPEL